MAANAVYSGLKLQNRQIPIHVINIVERKSIIYKGTKNVVHPKLRTKQQTEKNCITGLSTTKKNLPDKLSAYFYHNKSTFSPSRGFPKKNQ